jgi:hypothetical protein
VEIVGLAQPVYEMFQLRFLGMGMAQIIRLQLMVILVVRLINQIVPQLPQLLMLMPILEEIVAQGILQVLQQ